MDLLPVHTIASEEWKLRRSPFQWPKLSLDLDYLAHLRNTYIRSEPRLTKNRMPPVCSPAGRFKNLLRTYTALIDAPTVAFPPIVGNLGSLRPCEQHLLPAHLDLRVRPVRPLEPPWCRLPPDPRRGCRTRLASLLRSWIDNVE